MKPPDGASSSSDARRGSGPPAVEPARTDPDQNLDLELTEPVPWEGQPSLNTSEVDQLLQEAKHEGFLGGERGEGDGSISWWSGIRLTVKGLRRLGRPPRW